MEYSMTFDLGSAEQPQIMNMQQIATGAVNIPEKELSITMDMVIDNPDQGNQDMSVNIYFTDGWMYMNANIPGGSGMWTRMKLMDEMWAQHSQISSMTGFLESPVNMELAGSETINGVDCYTLSINPEAESITNWMNGLQGGQNGVNFEDMGISQMFENFIIKQWISKNNYLPVKQQITMKIDMTDEESDSTSGMFEQMSMEMDATLVFYDYNKPVDIKLPPEALNAMEIKMDQ
jgi:hypothetical protein